MQYDLTKHVPFEGRAVNRVEVSEGQLPKVTGYSTPVDAAYMYQPTAFETAKGMTDKMFYPPEFTLFSRDIPIGFSDEYIKANLKFEENSLLTLFGDRPETELWVSYRDGWHYEGEYEGKYVFSMSVSLVHLPKNGN